MLAGNQQGDSDSALKITVSIYMNPEYSPMASDKEEYTGVRTKAIAISE